MLTLCMLGNLSGFCCRLFIFFKINFSKNSSPTLLECQMVWNVGPDLGPNCLQRLSADDKVEASKKRVN